MLKSTQSTFDKNNPPMEQKSNNLPPVTHSLNIDFNPRIETSSSEEELTVGSYRSALLKAQKLESWEMMATAKKKSSSEFEDNYLNNTNGNNSSKDIETSDDLPRPDSEEDFSNNTDVNNSSTSSETSDDLLGLDSEEGFFLF